MTRLVGRRLSGRNDRRLHLLRQILASTQAHILSPALETLPDGGQRLHDVLVVPGERHAVLIALASTGRSPDLAMAIDRLHGPVPAAALTHPNAPVGLLVDAAAVLRIVVVLDSRRGTVRWFPGGDAAVPVVPLKVLARAFRDRDHPDEVWRELANGAGGKYGWPPDLCDSAREVARTEALAPRRHDPLGSPTMPRSRLRPSERRRLESLLSRCEGPPLDDWVRHEVEPGRLRLWHADPPTVLTISTARRGPAIAVLATVDQPALADAAAAVGEAVQRSLDQLWLDRSARASLRRLAPWRRAILIDLELEPLDSCVVLYEADGQPRRAYRIPIGVDSSPAQYDGQALLLTVARALSDALADREGARQASRRRAADNLLRLWALLPQALNTTAGASPAWSDDRFGRWGPPSPAEHATVDRMLQTAAIRRSVLPGARAGAEAQALLRQFAEDLLAEAATLTGTGKDAVLICADQLHRAVAARLHDDEVAAASMTGPWWQEHLGSVAPMAAAAASHTGAAELLVENALRKDSTGDAKTPDRPSWRVAAATAARARQLAVLATADRRRLTEVTVRIDERGAVSVTDAPGWTDLALYMRVRALTSVIDLAHEPRAAQHVAPEQVIYAPFQRFADVPETADLRRIGDALHEAIGAGLEAVVGVLTTAADHLATTGTTLRSTLVDDAAEYTGLPRDELDAAVRWLTLVPERLRTTPFEYWKMEARQVRLATQPLVRTGGEGGNERLLLIPGRIRLSQLTYLTYLEDGRLPIPRGVLSLPAMKPLSGELDRFRQRMNKTQEIDAHRIAEEAGLPSRRDIDPRKTRNHGLSITGQTDLLVAVPATRRVWVAEVKDPAIAFSPWEIADEIDDFHGAAADTGTGRRRRDEVGRLLDKTADISRQLPAALRLLGIPGSVEGWQARPIVLTRRLSPAAFVNDPRVPFALVCQADLAFQHEHLDPGPCLWFPQSITTSTTTQNSR